MGDSHHFNLLIKNWPEVADHSVDVFTARFSLARDVSLSQMPLLSKLNLILLSSHNRCVQASLEVFALTILYYLPTSIIKLPRIISQWWTRPCIIWVNPLSLFHLLKDFPSKIHKWNLFSRLLSSDDIIESAIDLDSTPGKASLKLSQVHWAVLIWLNTLAQLLFLWRLKSLLISPVMYFSKSCIFIIVFWGIRDNIWFLRSDCSA
jgi:hypothetical protein